MRHRDLKIILLNTINNAEDYIKDADIPEEVTVTADVKDFSMNMTLTVASSDMGGHELKRYIRFVRCSETDGRITGWSK